MRFDRLVIASSLVAAVSTAGAAQTTRWNDRIALDTLGDAPAVRVWIDGPRVFSYGDAVRVRFMTEDDAYVIVGRVDGNGHVTVLWPSNRGRSTEVRGGEEVAIRSRNNGSFASFYATDRTGSGYVFALASYDPFDLSRLSVRDFDRYVTGMYVGRPAQSYVGDPYRVVSRFAAMVLYDDRTPYDFDVDYYSVGSPSYRTSYGYSSLCSGFGPYGSRYGRLQERWDDELYYGTLDGYDGCGRPLCYGYSTIGYMGGLNLPFCGYVYGSQQVARGPQYPPPSRPDSARVPGWLVDSVGRTRPDTVGTRPVEEGRLPQRPRVAADAGGDGMVYGQVQRAPLDADNVDGGRAYSIPERALSGIRRRNAQAGTEGRELPGRPGSGSPAASGRDEAVTWVRPPREMGRQEPISSGSERLPRVTRRDRGDARADGGIDRGANSFPDRPMPPRRDGGVRSSEPTRFDAPSRNDGPRFHSPPPSVREGPQIRQDSPPPRAEPMRRDPPPPRVQVERPTPPPQPVREPSPPEKKP